MSYKVTDQVVVDQPITSCADAWYRVLPEFESPTPDLRGEGSLLDVREELKLGDGD